MNKYLEKARELRSAPNRHYNCAQAVLIPFAKEVGLEEEACYALASNFGSGMKMGGTCGAITGGLMALGLFHKDSPEVISAYYGKLREQHDRKMDCRDLLRLNREKGNSQKAHCDEMVYECVQLVADLIAG